MKKLIPLGIIGAALLVGNAAHAGTQILWRSSTTGTIAPTTTETPSAPALKLSYSGQRVVSLGANVALYPVVSHGIGPFSFSLSTPLPFGTMFEPANGRIIGIPVAAGSYPIEISVTDASGNSATASITIVVS